MKKFWLTLHFIVLTLLVLTCNGAPSLKIKVQGVHGELLESIKMQLQLKQEGITIYDDVSINAFYQEIPQEITKALEPYGYFKAKVTSGLFTHKNNKWEKVFQVSLGNPLKIASIDLTVLGAGSNDKKILKHLPRFPLEKGDVFRVDQYNNAKQFLFDLAGTYGYIAAFLAKKEVLIDLESNTAAIVLHFDTGPRYYFGETTFEAPFFSKEFLAKFLAYKPGYVYSSKKIDLLQEALSNSNFFQIVDVNPQIAENESPQVPVEIKLTPYKARQYDVGVGFGTDTGFRGSLGMDARYLTPSGQSFNGQIQGSEVQNDLELHYVIPGKYPPNDFYDFNLSGKTLNLDKGKSLLGQVGVGYITVIKKWQQTIKLSLQHEHYKLVDQPYETSTLLIPSISWLRTKKDDPIKPTKGYRVSLSIQGSRKHFVASNSFLQAKTDLKYMKTIFKRMQVILHATLGYTAMNDIDDLPLSLQFYTGGTQSIRGFGYNTIGPGYNLAVGSIELRQQIVGDWYLSAFFDAGNASNDLFAKVNKGVGLGIVYRTSVGTLELTYAKAVSQPKSPGRIQFSLGTDL
ncbi:MAG: BamA/TamA family outer membrane protein [Gammaproteobacteria bacterium]|nr:BamA/TamA family outer membrane protein [Gammaproteobacteria bacterium]